MKIAVCPAAGVPSRSAESIAVMKMCEAFSKLGHEVILLTPNSPDIDRDIKDPYKHYGIDNCFSIRWQPWFHIFGKRLIIAILSALYAKWKSVDLVYARSYYAGYISALLGLPVMCESHSPDDKIRRFDKWIFDLLLKHRNLKRLVVITGSLKRYYLEKYVISENLIRISPDAADEPSLCEKLFFQGDMELDVGYVGHMYPGKGMEIISKIVRRCPWAKFHCVGGLETDIEYWKSKLAGVDNIIFHGYVPYSKTNQFRQSFDILLAPYLKNVFGMDDSKMDLAEWMSPLKIFEYMSVGKPIVCSDLPVLREVLSHNETALLCDPEDIDSWVSALERLRDNVDLRAQLGRRARSEFMSKYTWEARVKNIMEGFPRTDRNMAI